MDRDYRRSRYPDQGIPPLLPVREEMDPVRIPPLLPDEMDRRRLMPTPPRLRQYLDSELEYERYMTRNQWDSEQDYEGFRRRDQLDSEPYYDRYALSHQMAQPSPPGTHQQQQMAITDAERSSLGQGTYLNGHKDNQNQRYSRWEREDREQRMNENSSAVEIMTQYDPVTDGTVSGQDGTRMPSDFSMKTASKDIIHCSTCVLYPPSPGSPPPPLRERPPECKAITVTGLPDDISEDTIREIFERCGRLSSFRLFKGDYCWVLFKSESSVDAAIQLSGYHIYLGSKSTTRGRLNINYAEHRHFQHEWILREERRRERTIVDHPRQRRVRSPSPPPLAYCSTLEVNIILEKIKGKDTFVSAVDTFVGWLDRGECNRQNIHKFYTIIQSANSHVRRLLTEKEQHEKEFQRAQEVMKSHTQQLQSDFGHINRVLTAACQQKAWDLFTKAQRKHIENWKKQIMEVKLPQVDEQRAEEEMEISDAEEEHLSDRKRSRIDDEDRNKLKEENDSLRWQLEAYKNEVDLVRSDLKGELHQKEEELMILKQQLMGSKENHVKELQTKTENVLQQIKTESTVTNGDNKLNSVDGGNLNLNKDASKKDLAGVIAEGLTAGISEREVKLVALISAFLLVHPFGAEVDSVCSYLQKLEPTLQADEVKTLMSRFPAVFQEKLSKNGDNLERRWQFIPFQTDVH